MVTLLDSRGVLRKSGEQLAGTMCEREHGVRSGREIRGVDAADPSVLDTRAHAVQPVTPAGGTDHQADPVVAGQADCFFNTRGVREIDHHLGAIHLRLLRRRNDRDDLVASFDGDLLDSVSHFSVAVKRELHDRTPTGASNNAA